MEKKPTAKFYWWKSSHFNASGTLTHFNVSLSTPEIKLIKQIKTDSDRFSTLFFSFACCFVCLFWLFFFLHDNYIQETIFTVKAAGVMTLHKALPNSLSSLCNFNLLFIFLLQHLVFFTQSSVPFYWLTHSFLLVGTCFPTASWTVVPRGWNGPRVLVAFSLRTPRMDL